MRGSFSTLGRVWTRVYGTALFLSGHSSEHLLAIDCVFTPMIRVEAISSDLPPKQHRLDQLDVTLPTVRIPLASATGTTLRLSPKRYGLWGRRLCNLRVRGRRTGRLTTARHTARRAIPPSLAVALSLAASETVILLRKNRGSPTPPFFRHVTPSCVTLGKERRTNLQQGPLCPRADHATRPQ